MNREHDPNVLSPEGERRKAQILREVTDRLPGIAARRRSRRNAVRGTLAIALLLTVGAAAVLINRVPSVPGTQPAPPVVVTPEPGRSVIDYAVVRTGPVDPSIYIQPDTEAINAMVISDDELLRELAAAGRPAGLVTMNGRVRLTRDVVDPPL